MTELLSITDELLAQILYNGKWKAALALLLGILLIIAVLIMIVKTCLRRRRYEIDNDPVIAHALRLNQFYLDRPLRAELILTYPDRKSRRAAIRQEYPNCDPAKLAKAVREAEFNEFIKFELDRDLHGLKKKNPAKHRASLNQALKLLSDTKRHLPSGIIATFMTERGARREMQYTLEYAHRWLDHIRQNKTDPTPADTFRAIKTNMYQCAYCHRDLNDGVCLQAVTTESGSLVPICRQCKQDQDDKIKA